MLIRRGKGGKRREVGMDRWAWDQLAPWLTLPSTPPVGVLFCVFQSRAIVRQGLGSSAGLWTRREKREGHVVIDRLAASVSNLAPCPHDPALIDLGRIGAMRLLGIKQNALGRLDEIVTFHREKPRIWRDPTSPSERQEDALRM